jgi:probable F420-dependent oxidoreductase
VVVEQTRPVRIGLQIAQHSADWPAFLAAAQEAEALGADALFNWDHFFGPRDSDTPSFECWTMLAAWAIATSRIALGPLVSCIGYRNPDLVADMARTVDHLAGGRMILGLGSGFKERDYVAYGYRYGSVADRVSDLETGVPRIRQRLELLNPPPLGTMPLLIAGSGERRTLRVVAQHADICIPSPTVPHFSIRPKSFTLTARRSDEIPERSSAPCLSAAILPSLDPSSSVKASRSSSSA